MTDKKPSKARPPVKRNIPGLGTVHLHRLVSVGIVTQAYTLTSEADEEDRPAFFANFILAHMLVTPSLSIEEIAQLPGDVITALVDVAVDALGIRSEYDETSADVTARERLFRAFDRDIQATFASFSDRTNRYVAEAIGDIIHANRRYMQSIRDVVHEGLASADTFRQTVGDAVQSLTAAADQQMRAFYDEMRGPLSRMLSEYRAKHVFIRCPACGHEYAISDPDLGREDLFESYQQCRGKECWIQCDKVLPQELTEELQRVSSNAQRSPCTCRFTLHDGLVEYKAEAPLMWFSRGPYTLVDEGVSELKVGQAVRPDLNVSFFQIDYVELIPRRPSDVSLKVDWRRVGQQRNQFEILTSAEHVEDIGKPIQLSWRVAGIRQLPEDEDIELWKRYLISSASKLMYEFDSRMSILESWMAFELFLDEFVKGHWVEPHLEDNLRYLHRVTAPSTATSVRLVLHEALGVHFVGSEVWQDWEYARTFRNQVAHGGRLQDTEYGHGSNRKKIGKQFENTSEIAKFCYSSVVRAVYFIRYWEADSAITQQLSSGNADTQRPWAHRAWRQ